MRQWRGGLRSGPALGPGSADFRLGNAGSVGDRADAAGPEPSGQPQPADAGDHADQPQQPEPCGAGARCRRDGVPGEAGLPQGAGGAAGGFGPADAVLCADAEVLRAGPAAGAAGQGRFGGGRASGLYAEGIGGAGHFADRGSGCGQRRLHDRSGAAGRGIRHAAGAGPAVARFEAAVHSCPDRSGSSWFPPTARGWRWCGRAC